MTSVSPPTYYFPGITFNSAFYTTSSSGGLTQAQANALYLKKNTADTATALETFNGGIASNSIQSTTASTDMSIGASQTSGNLNIGCKGDETLTGRTTGNINIGSDLSATGQIKLGNNASITPVVCRGSFTCNRFAQFDTALTVTSTLSANGNVNLATFINSGAIINILNGGTGTAGSVNIANVGVNTTAINIGSTTGTGVVSLQSASSVRLSDLKIVGIQLNNAINENTGNIYIGAKQTSGVLFLGSGDAYRTGEISIGNNACSVAIMSSGTTNAGNVNIANGNGINQTTNVNIATNTNTGTVTIGNPSNTTTVLSGTTNINTGVGNSLLPLVGTVNIATGTGATFVSTAVNVGTGNTTGAVTIGNSANTVQVNGGLSIGTGKNITLAPSTSYVSPTALTMLGGRSVGTVSTSLSGISNVVSSIRLTSAGIYIISWSYQISYTTRPTYFFSNVATGLTAIVTGPVTYGNSNYGYSDMGLFESLNRTTTSGSQVVVATLDNYYNLVIYISGGAFTGVGGFYNIVRIA